LEKSSDQFVWKELEKDICKKVIKLMDDLEDSFVNMEMAFKEI
jgi:hypothetical protein